MNTKDVGNVTESIAILKFISAGYTVLIPFGENCSYDLLAEKDGKFARIQCKTGRFFGESIEFAVCSTYIKNGKYIHRAYGDSVDFFFVHCFGNEKSYLVPSDSIKAKTYCRLVYGKESIRRGFLSAVIFEME